MGTQAKSNLNHIRLSRLILAFSVVFAVLLISPALLSKQFSLYPLMKIGDALDLLTPLILIPFYWLLYQLDNSRKPGLGQGVFFLFLAALWMEGQGIHLSANSIDHLMKEMRGTDAYALTNFYDEVLSHYLWHAGVVGLSALLVYGEWAYTGAVRWGARGLVGMAGIIYGFTYFIMVIEAGTAPLGVPYAALFTLLGFTRGRKRLRQQPLLGFFFVAHMVAVALFAGWAIYWRGLPEFSEVGIID